MTPPPPESQVAPNGDANANASREIDGRRAALADVENRITHPFRWHHPRTDLDQVPAGEFLDQWRVLNTAARSVGIPLEIPDASERLRGDLRQYADRSGLILRTVELPDKWWRHDYGPMLGETTDGKPVALVRHTRHYRTVSPAGGPGNSVTDQNEKQIRRQAQAVIAQLPEPLTSPWQIARYGLRGNLRWMILSSVVAIVAGLVTLVAPLATRSVWDTAVPQVDYSLLWGLLVFLLAASVAGMALTIVRRFCSLRVESRFASSVTPAVWYRFQRIQTPYFRENSVGTMSQQAGLVPGLFGLTLQPAFSAIGLIGFGVPALILMIWLAPTLTWVALAGTAVDVAVTMVVSWRSAYFTQLMFPLGARSMSTTHGLLSGVRALRTAGAEEYAMVRWAEPITERQHVAVREYRMDIVYSVFGLAWPIVITGVLYWVTGTSLIGSISVGTFLAFMAAYGFFKRSMHEIPRTIAILYTLPKVWDRCRPILQAPLERPQDATDPGDLQGRVALSGVSFSYSKDRPVLHDVDLDVPQGSFVAITGPSGSGKSTLLRLLLGLEDPTAGTIAVDDMDLAQLDVRLVRNQMGVVLQGMRPVGSTIRHVLSGTKELSDSQLWASLERVALGDAVHRLPMGLDTFVGSGGASFSAGEIQRLLVARALVNDPRILILDEATSALDDDAQRTIADTIAGMGITRIVVAHRLSTIRSADSIVVLDEGKVAQQGTYDELVAHPGLFADLAARQVAHP